MNESGDKQFFWGVSTSAHQVEGGLSNDWREWEAKNADALAREARRRVWPQYILGRFPSPIDPENYRSGRAADHYNRFHEDIRLAAALGVNAYRFSIEWSRVEPEEGKFSVSAIEHYRGVIRALRENGMEPFVTLWHFTHPVWFSKKGGWESRTAEDDFLRFVKRLADEFRNDVTFWVVLNEPGMWVADAYLFGSKPPGERSFSSLVRVYFALVRTQKRAYLTLKRINPNCEVGIAESMEYCTHSGIRVAFDYFRNFFFISRVRSSIDFIGVNYYKRVGLWGGDRENVSDMGWEIYPEGLGYFLRRIAKFKKPIYVTENGIADARDEKRSEFIRRHVDEVMRAKASGVPVKGYFHWSLLDNFEWNDGFWPRFGLFEVDYKTEGRIPKESAKVYAEIIRKFQTTNSKFQTNLKF
ncbi:MAG: hypothetical protein A2131_00855 [Candidatus Sungbacteria bacterium GWC2_49_10]|uniref:Beta-glucosidase n=2 Tax=Parcubacteria group TaxID=1794811 RepID=A0A1G2K7V3_9BACT|nr:MAG: Beta-glucosidase [Parcubacteria group bacterium GW2011_GWB1_50_9]OGZ94550.1 MAG: hypothetical protein A2131_00855 [Candidatus Sungbacteria bacterium GWC2_49_10]